MIQQVSVFVENQRGAILAVTKALAAEGLNIRAFSVYDTPEFSILRLVLDEPERALPCIREIGFFAKLTEVVAVTLEDRPRFLNGILETINEAGLQIHYMYSLMLRDSPGPLMILHTDDDGRAEERLAEKGYET